MSDKEAEALLIVEQSLATRQHEIAKACGLSEAEAKALRQPVRKPLAGCGPYLMTSGFIAPAETVQVTVVGSKGQAVSTMIKNLPDNVIVTAEYAKPPPHDPLHLTEAEALRKQVGKPVSPNDVWNDAFDHARDRGMGSEMMDEFSTGPLIATTRTRVPINLVHAIYGSADASCGDGVFLTASIHPQTGLLVPEEISPSSVEAGEYDSETGKVTWKSEYSPGFLEKIADAWPAAVAETIRLSADAGDLPEVLVITALKLIRENTTRSAARLTDDRNSMVMMQKMEDGTMREFKPDPSMLTGAHSWSASLGDGGAYPGSGAPIPDSRPYHFVEDRAGSGPQLWMRSRMGDWFMVKFGWQDQPEVHAMAFGATADKLPAGYRYLGPAEYVTPRSDEIPVTPEMLERGRYAGDPYLSDDELTVKYRAMHAVAPVELASENERQAVKEQDDLPIAWENILRVIHGLELGADCLRAERDEARVRITRLTSEAETQASRMADFHAVVSDQLAAKDARIAELKSDLANRPAVFIAPVPEPETLGWLRVKDPDRRRMGP